MGGQQTNLTEARIRSVIKAIAWRILASLTTMLLVFLFTLEMHTAFWVAVIEVVTKMVLYYGHERIWNIITWGRIPRRITNDE